LILWLLAVVPLQWLSFSAQWLAFVAPEQLHCGSCGARTICLLRQLQQFL